MAETRTTRLGLPHYSSGSDGFSRGDWNETVLNLESRAAIDQGSSAPTLPTTSAAGPGEYYQRADTTLGLRALYRSDGGGTFRAQNWLPETLRLRPGDGQAATAEGLRVDYPNQTLPGWAVTYAGVGRLRDSLVLGGSAATGLGRLAVGGVDTAPTDARARITAYGAERGLDLRAGNNLVTELLRIGDSGGSTVLSVSGAGQLTSTQGAAFGGATPGAGSITAAPQASGAIAVGVLAQGVTGAPARPAIRVDRYASGPAGTDTDPILTVAPDAITVGRSGAAWTGGQLTLGAPSMRAIGAKLGWYPADADAAEGVGYRGLSLTSAAMRSTIPAVHDNSGATTASPSLLRSYPAAGGQWTAYLLRAFQSEHGSAGNPDTHTEVARLDAAGRLLSNAPWRGSGTRPAALRDVRQPVIHRSIKRWVLPGPLYAGPIIWPGDYEFAYTFPTMTMRSASDLQLFWQMRLETLHFVKDGYTGLDRSVLNLYFLVSINGGTYVRGDAAGWEQETVGMTTSPTSFAPGQSDTWPGAHLASVPAGASVRVAFVARNSDGLGPIRVRRADLYLHEALIQDYDTLSEGQPIKP